MYRDVVSMEKNDREISSPKKSYKDSMLWSSNGDEQNNGIMTVILVELCVCRYNQELIKIKQDKHRPIKIMVLMLTMYEADLDDYNT